jgi:hypothetical protein
LGATVQAAYLPHGLPVFQGGEVVAIDGELLYNPVAGSEAAGWASEKLAVEFRHAAFLPTQLLQAYVGLPQAQAQ